MFEAASRRISPASCSNGHLWLSCLLPPYPSRSPSPLLVSLPPSKEDNVPAGSRNNVCKSVNNRYEYHSGRVSMIWYTPFFSNPAVASKLIDATSFCLPRRPRRLSSSIPWFCGDIALPSVSPQTQLPRCTVSRDILDRRLQHFRGQPSTRDSSVGVFVARTGCPCSWM